MNGLNSLNSHNIANPFGVSDICSKFIIEDASVPFSLHDICVVGQQYTFGFWIKSDSEGSFTVVNKDIVVTTEWSRHIFTFNANTPDFNLFFNTVGTYYIYHPKLEKGNIPTDWTPAPEDVDKAIVDKGEELGKVIVEQSQSAKDAANAYTDEKLNDYVESDDFISFEKDVSARLDVMDENVTISIETLTKQIVAVNNELTTNHNLILKYFEFGENGLVIGVTDNPYKTRIDNDRYSMTMNNVEILYFDGNGKGYIPDLTVDMAFNLLGLRFEKDSNGNLNCEYNGG